MIPPPDAAFQVRFLQQVQRILAEGSFVATYKFALLHALADLAVLKGDDEVSRMLGDNSVKRTIGGSGWE